MKPHFQESRCSMSFGLRLKRLCGLNMIMVEMKVANLKIFWQLLLVCVVFQQQLGVFGLYTYGLAARLLNGKWSDSLFGCQSPWILTARISRIWGERNRFESTSAHHRQWCSMPDLTKISSDFDSNVMFSWLNLATNIFVELNVTFVEFEQFAYLKGKVRPCIPFDILL